MHGRRVAYLGIIAVLAMGVFFLFRPHTGSTQRQLLIASEYYYGSLQNISPADVFVYDQTKKLIATINAKAGHEIAYANPQIGTPNEVATWISNNDVDAGFLPYPLYATLEGLNLTSIFQPVSVIPSVPAALLGNASACTQTEPLAERIRNGYFITENEFSPSGALLAKKIFSDLKTQPKTLYSGESLSLDDTEFVTHAASQQPTFFLTADSRSDQIKQLTPGSCIIQARIEVPWPLTVFVVRKTISAEAQKAINDALESIAAQRNTFFGTSSAQNSLSDLTKQLANFQMVSGPDDPLLSAPRDLLSTENIDRNPFFNLDQLMLRFRDWKNLGQVAVILPPAGARAAFGMGASSEAIDRIFNEGYSKDTVLVGNSGGAIGSLYLSLAPSMNRLSQSTLSTILDANTIIVPAIRYQILIFIAQYWPVFGLVFIVLLGMLFFTPVALWKFAKTKTQKIIYFLLFVGGYLFVLAFLPAFPLEITVFVVAALSIPFLFLLVLSLPHDEMFGYASFVGVVILTVVIVTGRGLIARDSILDRLDFQPSLRTLAASESDLVSCSGLPTEGEFSACLFKHLKFSMVISTSDVSRYQQVYFYIQVPGGATIDVPRDGRWVNLDQCPENLVKVISASASFPFVFPPVTLSCGGDKYVLLDGSIFSSGTSGVASSINATTALTFLNENFNPQKFLALNEYTFQQSNMFSLARNMVSVVTGRNRYHEFQSNLLNLRQIIFTPYASEVLPGDFDYFGIIINGVFYNQPRLFSMGLSDAVNTTGKFVQISGNRFIFDSFAKQLQNLQALQNLTTVKK